MKNLSNNKIISLIINLLFLVLVAKLLIVVVLWFLPAYMPESASSENKNITYKHFNFHNIIQVTKASKKVEENVGSRADIKSMILIGLYGNSSYGYAIVAMKTAPKKTEIISIGESYQGYRLQRIALRFVVFVKNNKEYILRLNDTKSAKHVSQNADSDEGEEKSISVSRNEINTYAKNPTEIWRDISIKEIKKGGKISGFKVTKVRKNSKIARLGLQRGDIIIKANGQSLTSYAAVMKIYQNLNKLESISLTIKRGNQEKEILYEIY